MLLTAGALGACAASAPAASAEEACYPYGGQSCGLSGQYSGHWEVERVSKESSETITRKLSLSWSEYFDGQYWELSSDGGTLSCSAVAEYPEGACAGVGGTASSCEGTLSLASGATAAFRQSQVEGYGWAGVGGFGWIPYISHIPILEGESPERWYVSVAPPLASTLLLLAPDKYEEFLTSSVAEAGSPCASNVNERQLDSSWDVVDGPWVNQLSGGECHYDDSPEVEIDWVSFPPNSSYSVPDDCSAEAVSTHENWRATLTQNVSLSSAGLVSSTSSGPSPPQSNPPPPAQYGPEFPKAKEEALESLRDHDIPALERYCGPEAAGLLSLTSGVLTGNAALSVAGGLTASALSPFCGQTIVRTVKDYKTHADPPLESVDVIARPAAAGTVKLPPCSRYHRTVRPFCERLRAAYEKLVSAATRTASIATALEETVSREHAAYLTDDATAIAAQDADLRTLAGELAGAQEADTSAGEEVAKALRGGHLRFEMSKKQSQKAIAKMEHALAKNGIGASELKALDAPALKPAKTNLLADLERL